MIGSFLELSAWARDIAASAAFWESLGFGHASTGDTWRHRYVVLTDGRLCLGLHDYEFDSPSLTFVRPGLQAVVDVLRARGVDFDFVKTADDEFHEAGFRDPAGQVVTLLEARTFSPGWRDGAPGSLLGHFEAYAWGGGTGQADFWERLGFVVDRDAQPPRLVADGITLAPGAGGPRPELRFRATDPGTVATALESRGHIPRRVAGGLELQSPEGLVLRVEPPA